MYKHTFKDFLDGSICVRCDTSEDKQRLLQLCTENGITKSRLSILSIRETVSFYNVFYVDRDELALSALSEPETKFCNAVPFASLSNDTHPRRIVINYSDTITTATLYNGEKAVKSAAINRRHGDKPSTHTAAVEVINKLLAKQVKQPKPKKPAVKDGFNVGDRVVCISDHFGAPNSVGQHGHIVAIDGCDCIGVEFDGYQPNSHDCEGKAKAKHGRWLSADNLRHEQPTKPEVREVKRCAEIGEYVKLTKPAFDFMQTGDIVRVSSVDFSNGSALVHECDLARPSGAAVDPNYNWIIFNDYVVLEDYQPEEPTNA